MLLARWCEAEAESGIMWAPSMTRPRTPSRHGSSIQLRLLLSPPFDQHKRFTASRCLTQVTDSLQYPLRCHSPTHAYTLSDSRADSP